MLKGSAGPAGRRATAAPALDGRANGALVAFVAERLGVPRTLLAVATGERSRDKVWIVRGDCDPSRLLTERR